MGCKCKDHLERKKRMLETMKKIEEERQKHGNTIKRSPPGPGSKA